jgi:putative ABC transport system ATP-binding protein
VKAIRGMDFIFEPASFVSFVGSSYSCKSTLFNMIDCIDSPTAGTLKIVGQDITIMDLKQAEHF